MFNSHRHEFDLYDLYKKMVGANNMHLKVCMLHAYFV